MKIGRKPDLLSPDEREIVDRLERGAIDAAEAGRLLIASVHRVGASPDAAEASSVDGDAEFVVDPNETPDEAAARELVERIAREVDAERKR